VVVLPAVKPVLCPAGVELDVRVLKLRHAGDPVLVIILGFDLEVVAPALLPSVCLIWFALTLLDPSA
jgi:hypothetical protein